MHPHTPVSSPDSTPVSIPRHSRIAPRPALRAAAGLALLPALALAGATPAAAHDELVKAVPAQGASATDAPSEVSLTFSGDLIDGQGIKNLAQVRDAHGSQWQAGPGTVDGPTLSVPLCEGLPNGAYDVAYRVVYSDGHSEEQTYAFTVEDPAAPAEGTAPEGCGVAAAGTSTPASTSPAAGESSAPSESTTAGSTASDPAASSAAAANAPASAEDEGLPGWVWPLGIGGLLVLGLGALALHRKASALGHLDADR